MRPFIAALLLGPMLALAAATPAAATSHTSDYHDVFGGLSGLITACTADPQCVVVDGAPCGCANGGRQVAINATYRQFWQSVQRDARKLPIACPAVYRCQPRPKASCVLGHCTTTPPVTGTVGVLPPP